MAAGGTKTRHTQKEFLNVDVDCVALKWTGGIDVDVSIDELPLVADEMDEKPLDIHNLSLLGSVLDVNVDSVEVPHSNQSHRKELMPLNQAEHDFDADEKPLINDSSDHSALNFPPPHPPPMMMMVSTQKITFREHTIFFFLF